MAARKRKKIEREHDLVIAAQMYFEGKNQYEIAAHLQLTQQQVSYDLKTLHKRWVDASLLHITEGKARELAKIDHLERVYWESWEKSKKSKNKNGEIIDRIGSAAMLSGVQWCIDRRCKILGFDAASKLMSIDMSKLNDGQLERLANGEDIWSVIADPGTG